MQPIQSGVDLSEMSSSSTSVIDLTITDTEFLRLVQERARRRKVRSRTLKNQLKDSLVQVNELYKLCEAVDNAQKTRNKSYKSLIKKYHTVRAYNTRLQVIVRSLKEELDKTRKHACVVCYSKDTNAIFLPCHHAACCWACVTKLRDLSPHEPLKCPICKQVAVSIEKIFYA